MLRYAHAGKRKVERHTVALCADVGTFSISSSSLIGEVGLRRLRLSLSRVCSVFRHKHVIRDMLRFGLLCCAPNVYFGRHSHHFTCLLYLNCPSSFLVQSIKLSPHKLPLRLQQLPLVSVFRVGLRLLGVE